MFNFFSKKASNTATSIRSHIVTAAISQSLKSRSRPYCCITSFSRARLNVCHTKFAENIDSHTHTHRPSFRVDRDIQSPAFPFVLLQPRLEPCPIGGRVTIYCCAATPRSRGSIPQRSCVRTIVPCVCGSTVQVGPIAPP